MANMIIPNDIGNAVYGVKQYAYTVDGDPGKDYIDALTKATFKQSVAIEEATSAYASAIRHRQRKLTDLGEALSRINGAIASMDPKSNDPGKTASFTGLSDAARTLSSYGISIGNSGDSISYRNAMTAQNNVQYALDIENNNIQQDMVTLQSMLSKRDNAYSMTAKLVKKANNAATSTIHNFQ